VTNRTNSKIRKLKESTSLDYRIDVIYVYLINLFSVIGDADWHDTARTINMQCPHFQ
jgi:hypothetical protein